MKNTGANDHGIASEATGPPAALAAGSVIAALGALGFASVVFLQPGLTARAAFASPTSIAGSIVATIGSAIILLALARQRVLGPSWAVSTASAGLLFAAAIAWFGGTGTVAVANATTDAQFDAIGASAWVNIMLAPKMVLCLVGFLALAITGWRDR